VTHRCLASFHFANNSNHSATHLLFYNFPIFRYPDLLNYSGKGLHIYQQSFTDGQPFARWQQMGKLADKLAVDRCKRMVQLRQVDGIVFGDGGEVLEVLLTKTDHTVASVFGEHGQAMGSADNGTGIVHEARPVFNQGTGAERIGMSGFVLDTAP